METTCGVIMGEDQSYLLEARLGPVARRFNYSHITEYVSAACRSTTELSSPATVALIDAMTTHETFFFRDPNFWSVMEQQVIPRALKARGGSGLKIWSAACSTGQEAYSVAMLLEEKFPAIAATTEIIASDVSPLAVNHALEGTYSTLEVNRGLGAQRLVRHFERGAVGFRVKDHLRRRIRWTTENLLAPRAGPRGCDIVLCRNVLIYFNERDRASVVSKLIGALAPTGALGIGSTETLRGSPLSPGWYLHSPS